MQAALFQWVNPKGWTVLGQRIPPLLTSGRHLRMFNLSMAGLLLATIIPASLG